MKNSTKLKAGLLLTSLACAAGATAALVLLQKKREEEVYHEAELKAMDELEENDAQRVRLCFLRLRGGMPGARRHYAAAKNDAAAAENAGRAAGGGNLTASRTSRSKSWTATRKTDEDDDEPENRRSRGLRHKHRRAEYALPVLFQEETLCLNMRAAYSVRLPRRTA